MRPVKGAAIAAVLAVVVGIGTALAVVHESRDGGGAALERKARTAARSFLHRYARDSGRVVAGPPGSRTVSEGQAYGMLLAVVAGDRARFHRIWGWTRTHLQRPDGLLSWLWQDGRVADRQSATDADLDAARALVVAGRRWHDRRLRSQGARIGRGVLRVETVRSGNARVLVAGPWARARRVLNPSYDAPATYDVLATTGQARRWGALTRGARRLANDLVGVSPFLAPDWAVLGPRGNAEPSGRPSKGGSQATFGLDAQRLPVRFAESCDRADRHVAAAMWPFLRDVSAKGDPVLAYSLTGRPMARGRNPLTLVAAAAAAGSAGDATRRSQLLDRAEAMDRRFPGYYGAAWVALGRAMLTTDLLGEC